jgi:predicted nucleic acid-binding protein
MKVYLDTCSLHRPLDDKAQVRIRLEAEAVLALLTLCEAGALSLVSSDILRFEVEHNPHPQRKAYVSEVLSRASVVITLSSTIEQRAKDLEGRGFKALDALHLASAEAEQVDYFCTCDDRFLKRAKAQSDITVKVVSPLELAQEIMP